MSFYENSTITEQSGLVQGIVTNCYYDVFAFNGNTVLDVNSTLRQNTFYFLDTIASNSNFTKKNSTTQNSIFSKVWIYDSIAEPSLAIRCQKAFTMCSIRFSDRYTSVTSKRT